MAHDGKFSEDVTAGYPSPFVSKEEKAQDKYGLKYFKAMYNEYINTGLINTSESQQQRFINNRKYSAGLQSIDKYKDLLKTNGDASYLNLDWSVISVIPKFREVVVGGMINQEYKIQCNAIDPTSVTSRDKEYKKHLFNLDIKQFSDEVESEIGIPVIPKGEEVFSSKDEIDLHMQLNYKQDVEIAMEQALDFTLYNNDWDEVKKQVITDLVDLNRAGTRNYRDQNDNIRLRYIDPVHTITSYTDDHDFKSIRHAGEIITMTISELRELAGTSFTEEDYWKIAKSQAGRNDNRKWEYGKTYYNYINGGNVRGGYEDYRVEILDAEFFSVNKYIYEKKSNNYGGYYFQKRPDDYELPAKSKQKRELINKNIKVVYKGMWIINSEYIFDYGMKENMIREKINGQYSTDTYLSFNIYAPNMYDMENKSLVEKMIPFADQMQICHLKMQQLVAKAAPKGMAIDISGLANALKGMGDGWKPLDMQNMFQQLGTYYYSSVRDDGTPMSMPPIQELENGIGQDLERLVGLYNHYLNEIRNVTGLSEARDASAPDKDSLVGVEKMRLAASNNSTRTINEAYLRIMERTSRDLVLMIQDNIEEGIAIEGYYNAIGAQKVEAIKIMDKALPSAEFGIKIEALPDEEEKMMMEQNIQNSIASDTLRLEDAIAIRRIAKTNVKLAEQMLILRRKRYQEEKQQEMMAAAQANAEQQAMAAQQASQAKMMEQQAESQVKSQLLDKEYQLKMQLSAQEHEQKMKEIALEEQYNAEQIVLMQQEKYKSDSLRDSANNASRERMAGAKGGGSGSQVPAPKVKTRGPSIAPSV
jgi:hypothetical protein